MDCELDHVLVMGPRCAQMDLGQQMELTRLIYASTHGGTTAQALDEILQSSRNNNARDAISGALVVSDEDFMQVLEGPRTAVARCFSRIMADPRHHNIQVLSSGDAEERFFSQWDMYSINAAHIPREIIASCMIDNEFRPDLLTSQRVKNLCKGLSAFTCVRLPTPSRNLAAQPIKS